MFDAGGNVLQGDCAVRTFGLGIILRIGDIAFSLCGRRWRFADALRLASVVRPVLRWVSRDPHPLGHLDPDLDRALVLTLDRMARRDVEFDPTLTVTGTDSLGAGGAIIISGHFFLNHLFLRWLHDRGRRVSIIMTQPVRARILGTHVPLDVIEADALCLVRARSRVAAGDIVAIPVDCISRLEGCRSVDTPYGKVFVSDKIMRFAELVGVPVLFIATHVSREQGEIIVNVVRPTSMEATVAYDEFCQFLGEQFA